jgi:cAMP-dependent protein kinase regulator
MAGESFGELALLYNTPRTISIRAKTDCLLWTLSRFTFNNIINEATINKRAKYEKFLSSIELLKEIDAYERSKIADALKIAKYKKGEYVVRQGDEGNMFFMIEDGELVALKVN